MKRLKFQGFAINNHQDDFYEMQPPVDNTISQGYYFLSNDTIKSVNIPKTKSPRVFIGVANPHSLHAIHFASKQTDLQRIVLIDNNLKQLVHFVKLTKLLKNNESRQGFISDLFCLKQSAKSKNVLNQVPVDGSIARGGDADNLFDLETKFWSAISFDEKLFQKRYGLKSKLSDRGILINAKTMGNINNYYATVFTGSRKNYKYWPFTAGFGTGYLALDSNYSKLRKTILSTPIYLIHGDMPTVLEEVVMSNKYGQIVLWMSNLKAFEKGNDGIRSLFKYLSRNQPLVVIADARVKKSIFEIIKLPIQNLRKTIFTEPKHKTIHKTSFAAVSRYLVGKNNLEIVNVPDWIDSDSGESKLPNTTYVLASDYLKKNTSKNKKFSSILLHILIGHGMNFNEFAKLANKAKLETDNLIILEHYCESLDFKNASIGTSPKMIRNILGKERSLEYLPGYQSHNRNFIMIYDNVHKRNRPS